MSESACNRNILQFKFVSIVVNVFKNTRYWTICFNVGYISYSKIVAKAILKLHRNMYVSCISVYIVNAIVDITVYIIMKSLIPKGAKSIFDKNRVLDITTLFSSQLIKNAFLIRIYEQKEDIVNSIMSFP